MRTGFAGSQKRASDHRSSLLRTYQKSDEGHRRSGEGRRSCGEIWRELKWLGQCQTTSKQYGSTSERAGMARSTSDDVGAVSIITAMFVLQNKAVDQHQRGAANGISMTAMSLFKAAGPAGAGAIFSWTQKRQDVAFFPGDHMIFFILNVIEAIGVLMTFKPFLVKRQNP
ncbi:hypothetical protein RHGRI_014706 [Rhododendron griersonianum]|uniref:Uncharacterized protein n=1 Tax=Rhododendron griersonianum TaxID=479676 RepID=A0AAV6KAE7_9ERIC|nr:hypothetical protein RHGRI_014706 [Rhododendron griersonianum]